MCEWEGGDGTEGGFNELDRLGQDDFKGIL